MTCMNWMGRSKQDGVATPTWWYASHVPPGNCHCPPCKFLRTLDSLKQPAEQTLGPNREGVRAIKAAHALWDELAKIILVLNAISEHGNLKAIVVVQERLLLFSVDSLGRNRLACNPVFPVVQSRRVSQGAEA